MSNFQLDVAQLDLYKLDGVATPATAPSDETWYLNNGVYFGFQNANVLSRYFRESNPNISLGVRTLPRADGSFVETAYYNDTVISIEGTIQASDRATMEALLDTMKTTCSAVHPYNTTIPQVGGTLAITLSGALRYFDNCYPTAEIGKMYEARDYYHIIYCPFKISFTCKQPYGRSASRTAFYSNGSFSSDLIVTLTNIGSATSRAVITIPVITAGSLSQITLTNQVTGEVMTISKTFVDGDVLEVDGEAMTVKINNVNYDFSGVFLSVVPGDNTLIVSRTGVGMVLALTAQFYPRYF